MNAIYQPGPMMNTYPVAMSEFCVMRDVQNNLLFQVRDIDRKPVSLPNATLTINIIDPLSTTLLMSRDLTVVNTAKGIYQLTIQPAEMDSWMLGPLQWSIIRTHDNHSRMLWTDQNYTAFGTVMLLDGPLPGPAPTITVDWADFSLNADWYYSPMLPGALQDGYVNAMQTFYLDLLNFIGTVRIDTAMVAQPAPDDWTAAVTHNYNFVNVAKIDVLGDFRWLRMAINLTAGTVIQAAFKG